jgi:hypothetical protein
MRAAMALTIAGSLILSGCGVQESKAGAECGGTVVANAGAVPTAKGGAGAQTVVAVEVPPTSAMPGAVADQWDGQVRTIPLGTTAEGDAAKERANRGLQSPGPAKSPGRVAADRSASPGTTGGCPAK